MLMLGSYFNANIIWTTISYNGKGYIDCARLVLFRIEIDR